MKVLYNRSLFCTVKRLHQGDILAETSLVGTDCEAVAGIRADLKTYHVKWAGWEIFRSPGGTLDGSGEVDGIVGKEAYFNIGGELRKELGDAFGGVPGELLSECVRGLIQAETFIQVERGYPTPQSYDAYWKEFYKDSCRYYSNLDRISEEWHDYVGDAARRGNLYNKNKCCTVYLRSDGGYTSTGTFMDSFHEMGVVLYLSPDGIAIDCAGNFLRAPDRVCFENAEHLPRLMGKKVPGLSKKDIAATAGGPQGCVHLVDILYDLAGSAAVVFSGV